LFRGVLFFAVSDFALQWGPWCSIGWLRHARPDDLLELLARASVDLSLRPYVEPEAKVLRLAEWWFVSGLTISTLRDKAMERALLYEETSSVEKVELVSGGN
jgi:hypothetical protein